MAKPALPYMQPEMIVKKMRRYAANRSPKQRFKDHLNDLSDKQLTDIYRLFESGMSARKVEDIIKTDWGELVNCGAVRLQLSWVLQQILRDERDGTKQLQKRVNVLKKEEQHLRTGVEKLETEIVKAFNPLNELAWMANMQHQRIQQFRDAEDREARETCGPDGDNRPRVNREIDSMVEKQRLLIGEFIKSLKELRELSGEGPQKDKMPRALSSVHVHLQGAVEHPREMISVIETYADDLDMLAISASDIESVGVEQ